MGSSEQEQRRESAPSAAGASTVAHGVGDAQLAELRLQQFAIARAALGILCLLAQLLRPADFGMVPVVFSSVFAAYGLGVLGLQRARNADIGLIGIVVDTIFFLAWSQAGFTPGFWLTSAFYLYLLLSAIMLHNWWDVCAVSGACTVFFIFVEPGGGDVLGRLVFGAGLLASVVALEKWRTERRLAEALRDVEDWRLQAAQTAEDERRRIAGDFHDGPLQNFISLQIRMEALRKILMKDAQSGLAELGQIQDVLKSQIRDVRAFIRGTQVVGVSGRSLVPSLRRVVDDFQKESGVLVRFQGGEPIGIESQQTSLEVVQVFREALHNVHKHAGATQVAATVRHGGGGLELTVTDNGRGFEFGGIYDLDELELLGFGPESIKRRVRKLDGQLTVQSQPGRGATLRIRIPA